VNPDLLSQLRDIHGAPQAPWWPPAPGWWVLALIALVLVTMLMRKLISLYRVRQRRKKMLGWVDALNGKLDPAAEPQAYLGGLNRIFKLVAVRAFPGQKCASMAGREWADFLVNAMADEPSAGSLEVMASGPYDPAPVFDAGVISELSRKWIMKHG
jgi:hypothetical protein